MSFQLLHSVVFVQSSYFTFLSNIIVMILSFLKIFPYSFILFFWLSLLTIHYWLLFSYPHLKCRGSLDFYSWPSLLHALHTFPKNPFCLNPLYTDGATKFKFPVPIILCKICVISTSWIVHPQYPLDSFRFQRFSISEM